MILSCVVLTQYSSVPDRQTDRQKDASAVTKTRLALHAVARKNTISAFPSRHGDETATFCRRLSQRMLQNLL